MADRTVVIRLQAAVGAFNAQMASAAAATRGVQASAAGAAPAMTKMGAAGGGAAAKLKTLTPLLVGAGGIAYGLKTTADAAIGWESAFTGVRKTVEGTPEQFAALEDGLRGLSTEIPTSAEGLAKIAELAGQLGIETDSIMGFTRVIADLGETTNLSAEQGATELARFANVTGMAQGDFDRLGSTIVDLGNNFATTESEIVAFGSRLAGAGTTVGMSEADILALGTALSSVGINAEAGGTAFSKLMINIASEVETGGDQLGKFAEVAGMSADEFSVAWRDDAASALVAFVTGLGDVEAQGGSTFQVLEDLGITEQRMRDSLLKASSAQDIMNDALATGNRAWSENTALTEEANLRYETTEAKIQIAKNAVADFATELGGTLLPIIGDVAEALTSAFTFEIPGTSGMSLGDALSSGLSAMMDPWGAGQDLVADISGRREQEDVGDFVSSGQARVSAEADTARWDAAAAAYGRYQEALQQRSDEAATARLQGLADSILATGDASSDAASKAAEFQAALETAAGKQENAARAADLHRDALSRLADQQRAAVDPVFAMNQALETVDQAQRDYNTAVAEHGPKSQEAQAASLALASAVAGAEQAALDGDLSFDAFSSKLDGWVASGRITAAQADAIRSRVAELRGEAEDYQGDYDANVDAITDPADRKLARTGQLLARTGEPETSHVDSNTSSAERKLYSVNRLLSSAGRNVTSTVTTHFRTTGSRGPGVDWKKRHSGGLVGDPSADRHQGMLRSDEEPTVLQRGEFVVNKQAASRYGDLLEAINSGRVTAGTSGTSTGGGQSVAGQLAGMSWKLDIDPSGMARITAQGNRRLSAFGGSA